MKRRTLLLSVTIAGIIISPAQGLSLGPANIRLVDMVIVFLFIITFIHEDQISISKIDLRLILPLLGILLYSVLLLPFQSYPISNSMLDIIELIEIILLFILLTHHLHHITVQDGERLLYLIYFLTVLGSAIAIIFYLFSSSRFVGVPIIFGISSFSLYYSLIYYMRYQNLSYILGSGIILTKILLSQSRSIWIVLPIPIVIIALFNLNNTRIQENKNQLFRVAGIFISIGMGVITLAPPISQRFLSIVRASQQLLARPVVYYSGLQIFFDHPFGIGLGNYAVALQDYALTGRLIYPDWFRSLVGDRLIQHLTGKFQNATTGSHSDIFSFLIGTGLIGLVLYILFWLLILRLIFSAKLDHQSLVLKLSLLYIGIQSVIGAQLVSGGGPIIAVFLSILISNELAQN